MNLNFRSMRVRSIRVRSMRARMTALFALFVALLMLAGGAAMQHREARRAEKRSHEILALALDRAHDELNESRDPRKSLLQVVRADASELAAGGLTLMVTDARGVLWQSRKHAPKWPVAGRSWRVQSWSYSGQTLILAQDWEPIAANLRETARSLWQLGVLVVCATALAAWLVVGRTLAPLHHLAAQAQTQSHGASNGALNGGLEARLKSPSSDAEMRHLTQTLNDLLGRKEKEAQARGRFYAAASHELRTPIQVLLGQIDVARARPRSVASHEEILVELQGEAERLALLVQDLLQLNALEMRQNLAPREALNLAFWVERALSQQDQTLAARALKWDAHLSQTETETEIEAPPTHIEVLLRNLLENAVKYATPGSQIRVEIENGPPSACLRVWNACHLPPGASLEDWFEPFYRPDASRNSQTGGNGLGLSIVAALARTNGWDLQLHTRDAGIEALVVFPKADAALLHRTN